MEEKEATKFIRDKIDEGTYSLFLRKNVKSYVWQCFRGVLDDMGQEIFGIACCSNCHACIRYKSIKDGKSVDYGTTNLRDHLSHSRYHCGNNLDFAKIKGKKDILETYPYSTSHRGTDYEHVDNGEMMSSEDVDDSSFELKTEELSTTEVTSNYPAAFCKVENILEEELLENINNQLKDTGVENDSFQFSKQLNPTSSQVTLGSNHDSPSHRKRPRKLRPNSYQDNDDSVEVFNKKQTEDDYDLYGRHIANELRSLPDEVSRSWAKFQIQKILFEAYSYDTQSK